MVDPQVEINHLGMAELFINGGGHFTQSKARRESIHGRE